MYPLIEMTDTFGGETNYAWVKRIERVELPRSRSEKVLKRFVKKKLGIEGTTLVKHCDTGDFIAWDIRGACVRVMLTLF